MEFHGTWWHLIWRPKSSMESHGIFHGSQREPDANENCEFINFHGIPWNSAISNLMNNWSFHSSMEFHGTCHICLGIPWNARFHGIFKNSMELSLWPRRFHGIPRNFMEFLAGSKEFHRIVNFWYQFFLIDCSSFIRHLWQSTKHIKWSSKVVHKTIS